MSIPTNNLELWLDASDINSVSIENSVPVSITDKSGKTGAWSVFRGATINNAQNNLSSIRFSGTGDAIVPPNSVSPNAFSFMHNSETNVFGVIKMAELGSASSILSSNHLLLTTYNNKDIGPGYRMFYGVSSRHGPSVMAHINKGVSGEYVVGLTALNQFVSNGWYIFHIVTRPAATALNRGVLTVGNRSFSNNIFNSSASNSSSQSRLRLISIDNNNDSITGELGELLIYRGAMSELDIFNIKDILANKWGLSSQLVPLTPTPTPTITRTPGPTSTPTPSITPSSTPEIQTYISNTNSSYSIKGISSFSVDRDNMRLFYTTSTGDVGIRSIKTNNLIQYAKVGSRSITSSVYNSFNDRLYIGNTSSTTANNTLTILDGNNLSKIQDIDLGTVVTTTSVKFQAKQLILDKTNNKLYGFLDASSTRPVQRVVRWDLTNNASVNILTSLYDVYDMYLDEPNNLLYVSAKSTNNTNQIYKISTITDTLIDTFTIYGRNIIVDNNKIIYTDIDTFYIRDLSNQSLLFSYKLHTTINRFTQNGPYAISYDRDTGTAYVFDAYARNRDPKFLVFNTQNNGSFVGMFGFGGANGTNGVNRAHYDPVLRKNFAMTTGLYLYAICPENLVKNNGFSRLTLPGTCVAGVGKITKQTGYMTPWTVSANADIVSMSFCNSVESYNPFASLGPSSGSGFIEQTIQTVSGYDYMVEFRIGLAPGFSSTSDRMCRMSITADNNQILYDQLFNVKTSPSSTTYSSLGWQTRSAVFTANSNSCKLKFYSPDPNISIGGAAIDNVIVTRTTYSNTPLPTPTPSPSAPSNISSAISGWNFNIGSLRLLSTSTKHSQTQPAFYGGVMVDDENVVFTPFTSTNIGLYNIDNLTYTDGPAHGKVAGAFFGGVLCADKVIMIPHNSNNIGIYDTSNKLYSDGPVASGFAGGVVTPSGLVVMAPHTTTNIGLYNSVTNTFTAGPAHNQGNSAVFAGVVYMPNNKVLLVPRNADNIGIYDIDNNSYSNGPAHNMGDGAFIGGVWSPRNNKVILIPHNATHVGVYDIATNTYSNGAVHNRGGAAFAGGVLLPDLRILLVPHTSTYVGIYDPVLAKYTNGPSIGAGSAGRYVGGLLGGGDRVIMCPANNAEVRHVTLSNAANITRSILRSLLLNKF